jgi:hypothetical protein
MIGSIIGFLELGAIILAWMIFWNFLIRSFTANHSNNVAAQGLAAVLVP